MPNDPQSLVTDGKCFFCYNLTAAQVMELQLLVNKLQGGGGGGCTPPGTPTLALASQTDTTFTFTLTAGSPAPTSGYIIKWGTASGGPYTGSKTIALPGPYSVGTADGLLVATQYFFVAYADNGSGCVSLAASNEISAILPVVSGLILRNNSTDFDGSVANSNITAWLDTSGNAHHWANGGNDVVVNGGGSTPSTPPTVDKVRTANGHATVRFAGAATPQWFKQALFFGAAGFSGLTVMCVLKRDNDPPLISGNAGGPFQFVHPLADFPSHEPFTDSHVYEGFGRTTRPDTGNPVLSFASAFRVYGVKSQQDGSAYDVFLDNEAVSHLGAGGYTYSQQGSETFDNLYFLGLGEWYGNSVYMFQGNIAAVYVWNRVLSKSEYDAMRTYFNGIYGTSNAP